MSNKFTEEQYNKLVEIQEGQYSDDLYSEPRSGNKAVEHVVEKNNPEMTDFIDKNYLGNQAIALMNPITREWAHDKFVEKEKKYVWQSKQETDSGKVKRLYNAAIGITDSFVDKTEPIHNGNFITESEIRAWGYNPEMFDKEDV